MRLSLIALLLLVLPGLSLATQSRPDDAPPLTLQIPAGEFVTLCFHDVRDDMQPMTGPDPYAVSTKRLAAFFDWMHENDWNPVSLQQIVDARAGKGRLPPNAVLLSFDDGLKSIYTKVFPLMQAYGYPALFALQTGWLTRVHSGEDVRYQAEQFAEPAPQGEAASAAANGAVEQAKNTTVTYNGEQLGASGFVSWAELREMRDSGLASFATHTHDLHRGILANPQGNQEPAAITRLYLPQAQRYETDQEYHARIRNDLQRSMETIRRQIGVRPTTVVWPYGAYNQETADIARSLGLALSFGLGMDNSHGDDDLPPGNLNRILIMNDPDPVQIERQVASALAPERPPVQRVIQVDLDYVYDPDPVQTNRNLGMLLDRIKAMQIRTVYLQAYADPDGDGVADALYFPNSELPMRADLFNRVAWQLRTRAGVRVYAWMPLLAFALADQETSARLAVTAFGRDGEPARAADYHRLSPFLPQTARIVGKIYADLGRAATGLSGVLIHDDAYLAEDEDATACRSDARWPGTDRRLDECRLSPRQKTRALIDFGDQVVDEMRHYLNFSNGFAVARNLYARVVLEPAAEARFAQALEPFVVHYDEVALMAMPYLDGASLPPEQWLNELADQVDRLPGARNRVVYELQAKDWRSNEWIPAATLRNWMHLLVRRGALNLGYYPDDFLGDQPQFGPTFEGISLKGFPHDEVRP